jgi:hypothetical protein
VQSCTQTARAGTYRSALGTERELMEVTRLHALWTLICLEHSMDRDWSLRKSACCHAVPSAVGVSQQQCKPFRYLAVRSSRYRHPSNVVHMYFYNSQVLWAWQSCTPQTLDMVDLCPAQEAREGTGVLAPTISATCLGAVKVRKLLRFTLDHHQQRPAMHMLVLPAAMSHNVTSPPPRCAARIATEYAGFTSALQS